MPVPSAAGTRRLGETVKAGRVSRRRPRSQAEPSSGDRAQLGPAWPGPASSSRICSPKCLRAPGGGRRPPEPADVKADHTPRRRCAKACACTQTVWAIRTPRGRNGHAPSRITAPKTRQVAHGGLMDLVPQAPRHPTPRRWPRKCSLAQRDSSLRAPAAHAWSATQQELDLSGPVGPSPLHWLSLGAAFC
jgi:hypothetical protein